MKRQSIEDYQRARAEQRKQHTTPGDEERKQRIKDNGLECLRRLHGDQTWEDWRGTGEALLVITEEAMAEVGVSEWDKDNKRLVKEFNQRWDEYEARALRAGTNDKPLSKQERWALREVMTNPEIGAWRGLLDGPQQRRLNHPNAVVNKWKASTQTREPKAKRPPSDLLSPALTAKNKEIEQRDARIAELEEELQTAHATMPETGQPQTIDQVIAAFAELVKDKTPTAIKAVMKKLQDKIVETYQRRRDGIPTRPEPGTATKKKRGKKEEQAMLDKAAAPINAALGRLMRGED